MGHNTKSSNFKPRIPVGQLISYFIMLQVLISGCANDSNQYLGGESENSKTEFLENNTQKKNSNVYNTIPSIDIPKLVDNYILTFDENFNPQVVIHLTNRLNKEVNQIEFLFDFSVQDSYGGTMESSMAMVTKILTLSLSPGESTITNNLPIPSPQVKFAETPVISVSKVRYSDGTMDSSFNQ